MKRRVMTIDEIRSESTYFAQHEDYSAGIFALVDVEDTGFCKDGVTRWYHFTDENGNPAVFYKNNTQSTELINQKERIYTPRFCTVNIEEYFDSREEARKAGYTEPTHYHKDGFTVLGKTIGVNRMEFAKVKE